jgi:tetratricopeptide (TPR) repeat protein
MEQVRGRLFSAASEFYGRFLAERGSDPTLRHKAGKLAENYGNVLQKLGQNEAAEREIRKALEMAQELRAQFPDRREHVYDEAAARYSLGLLFKAAARFADAEEEWKQSARIYQELIDADPERVEYQRALADTWLGLGGLLFRVGSLDRARKTLEQARDLNAALVARHPERTEFQEPLANSWSSLAMLYRTLKQTGASRTAFERSLDIQERLAKERPQTEAQRQALAFAWRNFGGLLDGIGEVGGAAKALARSIEIRAALTRDFPSVLEYRRDLANARTNMCELLMHRSRLEDAEAQARDSITLLEAIVREQPDHAQHRSDLGLAWMQLGAVLAQRARAGESLEALVASRRCHEEAIARDANDVSYPIRLGRALAHLGQHHLRAGDRQAALPLLEEAEVRLREGYERTRLGGLIPLLVEQLVLLSETRLAEGDPERAAENAEQLAKAPAGDQVHRVMAVRLLARCARAADGEARTRFADRAMAMLKSLENVGAHGLDPSAEEFEVLRDRADFAELFRQK